MRFAAIVTRKRMKRCKLILVTSVVNPVAVDVFGMKPPGIRGSGLPSAPSSSRVTTTPPGCADGLLIGVAKSGRSEASSYHFDRAVVVRRRLLNRMS